MNIKQLLRKIVLKIRGEIEAVDADLQSAKRDISGLQSGKANKSETYTKTETDSLLSSKADKSDVSEVDIDLEGTGTIVSIPENATGYGTIEKMGGKSYKSENLLVLEDKEETTTNGITYSIKNGVITLNGTASSNFTIYLNLQKEVYLNGSYTICSFNLTSNRIDLYFNLKSGGYTAIYQLNVKTSQTITYTDILNRISLFLVSGSTYDLTINFMLVEGSTAPTEFSQGFEGIKIEYPTNVKVVGRNLLPNSSNLTASSSRAIEEDVYLIPETYTFKYSGGTFNGRFTLSVDYIDGTRETLTDGTLISSYFTFKSSKTIIKIYSYVNYVENINAMLNYGDTALPYTPYTEHNLPQTNIINYVSTQLQTNHSWTQENASKWLGLGVGNDSNIINYANNKGIVKYSIIDMGTLNWTSVGGHYYSSEIANLIFFNGGDYDKFNGLCSSLNIDTMNNVYNNNVANSIAIQPSNKFLWANSTTTPTGLLIYELATPIEIDLSSLETEEHFECESNGSIIHDNIANYKYSFPVSLKGQVELNFEHDKEQQRDIDNLKKEIDLKANDSELNKSLYNLGTFDTISGNVITRQTGYYIFTGNENWTLLNTSDNYLKAYVYFNNSYLKVAASELPNAISNYFNFVIQTNYNQASNHLWLDATSDNSNNIGISISTSLLSSDDLLGLKSYLSQHNLILQYKLATSYTEEIIEGQPLITLDQQGSQWLRSEWEKGLNLWDEQWELGKLVNGVKTDSVNQIRSVNPIYVDDNTQYFINKLNYSNMACYSANNQYLGNATYQLVQNKGYIITTLENTAYVMFDMGVNYGTTYNHDIMLNKGTKPLPYQEYNGSIVREKQIEELKNEINSLKERIAQLESK